MKWKTIKSPTPPLCKLHHNNNVIRLSINSQLAELLKFNSSTKYMSFKIDEQNKLLACQFHINKVPGSVAITKMPVNYFSSLVTKIIKSLYADFMEGTYEIPFTINKAKKYQYLVLDINNMVPTTSRQMDNLIQNLNL